MCGNAEFPAARFIGSARIVISPRTAARNDAAYACYRHGRRRRHAFVSINERPRKTGGPARWKISHCRHSDQQLSELRTSLDLRAHAIQQHVVTSTYSGEL